MNPKPPRPKTELLNLDRLVFLIDGVFAITLTLLVLDLKVPDSGTNNFAQSLAALLPRLLIYLFAFTTIANQWAIHHRTFRLVKHGDNKLVVLSLVNLLFITLVPATAAIVGGFPGELLAAACFSVNALLMCLSACAVWTYVAANRQLLTEDADLRILKGIAKIWLFVAIGFGAALIAGFISIYLEYTMWVVWSPPISIWWGRQRRKFET
jgi:uncharacterized membrane protein